SGPGSKATRPRTARELMRFTDLLTVVLAAAVCGAVESHEPYLGASWASDAVVVTTASHRTIRLHADADQIGIEQVSVSADAAAVGWVGVYPNCCGSYPIPGSLIIYSAHRVRRFGNQPVWRWSFRDGSRAVTFLTGPV